MEAKRENRLVILFAGFFILALISTMLTKILPEVLKVSMVKLWQKP